MRIILILLGLALFTAKSQIVIHEYNVTWSGLGVTATGTIIFNSSFNNYNPSSIGNNDYNGPISGLITSLDITVTGDANPQYNGTFNISNYNDLQWNTGGSTLGLTSGEMLPHFGNGADFSIIANNTTFAPTSDWSDPLLTIRTGNGNGTLLTMQSFSAVPEPEEWMAITSAALIIFGVFYSKIHKKAIKD